MFRKIMLAGLMAATVLSGAAPAYAQRWGDGQRSGRPTSEAQGQARPGGDAQRGGWRGRGDAASRPSRQAQSVPSQGWRQRAQQDRPAAPRPPSDSRWRNQGGNRFVGNDAAAQARPAWQGSANRQGWRGTDNDNRQGRDWRSGTDRRWDSDRRADYDRRGDDDRRWNNDRDRGGGRAMARFDDRSRWSNQRRWDNGWRNDRRYDWQSYRTRYGDRYRLGRYYAPSGWDYGYRPFSIGVMLGAPFYASSYWLDDPWSYRLPPAYGTLRWVRYYDDALLVDIRDGYVVDVIHDFFW